MRKIVLSPAPVLTRFAGSYAPDCWASDGDGGTVDNGCDPTGGFSFTEDTVNNFGRINIRRGHRIVEFALKYFF